MYVRSYTLLLADVFENFVNDFDPTNLLSAPRLAWKACLKKKTEIKLELLTDFGMLLMIGKGIRGRICHAIHRHAKANNNYMKN